MGLSNNSTPTYGGKWARPELVQARLFRQGYWWTRSRTERKMQCPYCGSDKLKVLDTTDIKNGIRRRRECQLCGERFTTYERSLATVPVLIKGNGNREEFDREKLKRGIWNACAKRPIPAAEIERLAMRVEAY